MINLYFKNFNFNLSNYIGLALNPKNDQTEFIKQLSNCNYNYALKTISFNNIKSKVYNRKFNPISFHFGKIIDEYLENGFIIMEDINIQNLNDAVVFNAIIDLILYKSVIFCPVITQDSNFGDIYDEFIKYVDYKSSSIAEVFRLRLKYFSAVRIIQGKGDLYPKSLINFINFAFKSGLNFSDKDINKDGIIFYNKQNLEFQLKINSFKKIVHQEYEIINKNKIIFNISFSDLYFNPQILINKMKIFHIALKKHKIDYMVNKVYKNRIQYKNYDELSKIQKIAKEDTRYANLIIAGAGSGKTRVIVNKFLYLLNFIPAYEILILTFTNNAVNEIKNRIYKYLNIKDENPVIKYNLQIMTYHSFFYSLIKEYYKNPGFKILPDIITDENSLYNPKKTYDASFLNPGQDYKINGQSESAKPLLISFNNIISLTDKLLKDDEVVYEISSRYKYILVDEYQDLNFLSDVIIKKIDHGKGNIMFAGDDDQSIYSFNGGDLFNLLSFDLFFPSGKAYVLQTNYRSNKQIIDFANSIIKKSNFRFPKIMKHVSESSNDNNCNAKTSIFQTSCGSDISTSDFIQQFQYSVINIVKFKDTASETKFIFEMFVQFINNGKKPAILVRTQKEELYYITAFKKEWAKYISNNNDYNAKWFIGTIHKSKGMEFDVVFTASTSNFNIPANNKNKNSETSHPLQSLFYKLDNKDNTYSEEIRLFYVAISRAIEFVFVTYSGVKSGFI